MKVAWRVERSDLPRMAQLWGGATVTAVLLVRRKNGIIPDGSKIHRKQSDD